MPFNKNAMAMLLKALSIDRSAKNKVKNKIVPRTALFCQQIILPLQLPLHRI